jgi:hypothetical protein
MTLSTTHHQHRIVHMGQYPLGGAFYQLRRIRHRTPNEWPVHLALKKCYGDLYGCPHCRDEEAIEHVYEETIEHVFTYRSVPTIRH